MRRALQGSILIISLIVSFLPVRALAQEAEEPLTLEVRRIFGFRFMNRIQGRFNFVVKGPDNLQRVEILVDGEVKYAIDEEPFKLEFSTGELTPGLHSFHAIGYTGDGQILQSDAGSYNVLTADEANAGLTKYFLPIIIGIVVLVTVVGMISGLITGRKGKVRIGEYGPAGGAVCKRCGLPFSRHVLSPNLVVGKLERCPNCGAVAIVRRGSPVELKAAEERLLASMQGPRVERDETEEDRLRRMIDDSRFDDF